MGMKSSGSTTTTQNSQPWSEQQPYLRDIFTEAQGLYQGAPPEYYQGETYADPNDWQQWGIHRMVDAGHNTLPYTATGFNEALLSGGYLYNNPAMAFYNSFAGENAGLDAPGSDTLEAYARGDYLNAGNPYIDGLTDSVISRVVPQIQSQFISGGTLSSPEAARASSEGATSAISPFLFEQYQKDQQNQMMASRLLGDRFMQGRTLQQDAAGGLSSAFQSGMGDMMRALALTPSTYSNMFMPGQNMFAAGSAAQQLEQQGINDEVQRWNFNQTLPWDMLNQYIGQVTGNYGGTTTLNQPLVSNPMQSMMGGIGTLASIFSMFSDRRLKEDIRRVGTLDNGLPVYVFRYVNDPMPRIGLMADDVEQVHPEAVVEDRFGYKMVNYGRAVH